MITKCLILYHNDFISWCIYLFLLLLTYTKLNLIYVYVILSIYLFFFYWLFGLFNRAIFCLIILNIYFKVLSHICMHIIILYYVYYITIDIIFCNSFQLDTMQTPHALWANLHPLPFAFMLTCIIYIHFKPQKTFFLLYWSVINT